ncbi:MAG TPA: RidA family protein [Thermoplasmata archaeon]|nr:RidA family protein [Thermoplasmata archaeon]
MVEPPKEVGPGTVPALPPPPKPAGQYASVAIENGWAWVSGQIVTRDGKADPAGLVGREISVEAAREVAGRAALQALSALSEALGSLERVRRIVRLSVYVASPPGFDRAHEVANGASERLFDHLGEGRGRGSRIALGVAGLPLNAPVEVDLVAAID